VAFVLALVLVSDLPVVHDHDAPGLYDPDCPLEQQAANAPPIVSSPSGPDVPHPAAALDPGPAELLIALVSDPFGFFESRAPPRLAPRRPLAP
jgi:hypothetical protein